MKTIIHHLRIHTRAEKVFEALTTEEGLAGWWSTEVVREGGTQGELHFTFVDGFNPQMDVVAAEEDRVEWICMGGHDNWRNDRFTFEIRDISPGETDVTFRQEYSRELDDRTYGEYNFNWGYYLGSLKACCETGEGTPFRPEG